MRSDRLHYLPFICLCLVYLLFPTQNANIDSWYYAASTKHGQDLTHSHHLIYNVIGRYWYLLLKVFNPKIEAISALNTMNALAATGSLCICYRIFLQLQIEKRAALWLAVVYGSCFGFMRYATDAETYILPLLCSLAATYYFLKDKLLPAALFSILAILVHELHICWALAMFIALLLRRPFHFRSLVLFATPFLIVPLAYYMAYKYLDTGASYWSFIMGEYSKGNAGLDLSLKSLALTGINFVRSFIQLHGLMIDLYHRHTWVILIPFTILVLSVLGIIYRVITKSPLGSDIIKNPNRIPRQSTLFLVAFLLHFLFAFLSSGNAEFMVMLPFLFIALCYTYFRISYSVKLVSLTIFLFSWNFCIAILPSHIYNVDRVDKQVEWTKNKRDGYFLWTHKPLVENILTYKEGFDFRRNYISIKHVDADAIYRILATGNEVYTDIGNPASLYSREAFTGKNNFTEITQRYYIQAVDSFENLYGKNFIYAIKPKP